MFWIPYISRDFMYRPLSRALSNRKQCIGFIGEYSMHQFRSNIIAVQVMFPSPWWRLNLCLCCVWCELNQHGSWGKPYIYLHSVCGLWWIVRTVELVIMYKWLGWIRQGGGEVDVCEWILEARTRESGLCTGTRRQSRGVPVTACRVG